MDTIATLFGHKEEHRTFKQTKALVDNATFLGIEIELEQWLGDSKALLPYWKSHEDHSLRGPSVELVFSLPYNGLDAIKALMVLENYIDSLPTPPLSSNRTSTHVHVDIRHMNKQQLYNYIILYIILERSIYKYVGGRREKSIFCVPFYKASSNISLINSLMVGSDEEIAKNMGVLGSEYNRYSGLNLHSLFKFGTLEFRMLGAEYKKDPIAEWLNILLSIKKYAINMRKPLPDLNIHISEHGADFFLEEVFGKLYPKIYYEDIYIDILKGIRLAQDIIYTDVNINSFWDILFLAGENVIRVPKEILEKFNSMSKEEKKANKPKPNPAMKNPKLNIDNMFFIPPVPPQGIQELEEPLEIQEEFNEQVVVNVLNDDEEGVF